MTEARPVTADDLRRLTGILDRLQDRSVADRRALAMRMHPSADPSDPVSVAAEARRLDDLDDAIDTHRVGACAVRPEDCWLLVPHLAHYPAVLTQGD